MEEGDEEREGGKTLLFTRKRGPRKRTQIDYIGSKMTRLGIVLCPSCSLLDSENHTDLPFDPPSNAAHRNNKGDGLNVSRGVVW